MGNAVSLQCLTAPAGRLSRACRLTPEGLRLGAVSPSARNFGCRVFGPPVDLAELVASRRGPRRCVAHVCDASGEHRQRRAGGVETELCAKKGEEMLRFVKHPPRHRRKTTPESQVAATARCQTGCESTTTC